MGCGNSLWGELGLAERTGSCGRGWLPMGRSDVCDDGCGAVTLGRGSVVAIVDGVVWAVSGCVAWVERLPEPFCRPSRRGRSGSNSGCASAIALISEASRVRWNLLHAAPIEIRRWTWLLALTMAMRVGLCPQMR
eukprot:1300113-Amphidinium_carterae.1